MFLTSCCTDLLTRNANKSYRPIPVEAGVEEVRNHLETVSLDGSDRTLSAMLDCGSSDDDNEQSALDMLTPAEADHILASILPVIRGIGPNDLPEEVLDLCRNATVNFSQAMATIIDSASSMLHLNQAARGGYSENQDSSASASPSGPGDAQQGKRGRDGTEKRQNSKKRKSDPKGDGTGGGDDGNNNDDGAQSRPHSPQKRLNPGLRLRCPFRARNPYRFNVRDYHSCAMTFFTAFSDLRYVVIDPPSKPLRLLADTRLMRNGQEPYCQETRQGNPH
jgi:hypothetical protein